MESTNNLRYRCCYCSKDVLTSSYFTHLQKEHFELFWTEENIKHLNRSYNQAKTKGTIDVITVPEVKGLSKDSYYLNPFNKVLYKQHTKATQAFDKTNSKLKTKEAFVEFCESIFNRLKYTPQDAELEGEKEHIKKLFQDIFNTSDYQNEQIKRSEILVKKLKHKYNLTDEQVDELDCEADVEARQIEKEELLSAQQIDKYSKLIKSIPLTRQKVFEKPTAPAALPAPPQPAPEPEKKPDEITVKIEEPQPAPATVIEQPSIPPVESKPKIAKKQLVKREPVKVDVVLPPEPEQPAEQETGYHTDDSDAGLTPLELMKKNMAKDDRRAAAATTSSTAKAAEEDEAKGRAQAAIKQTPVFNTAAIKQSLLHPTRQEESDRPRVISDTKQRIPKKSVSGFPVR